MFSLEPRAVVRHCSKAASPENKTSRIYRMFYMQFDILISSEVKQLATGLPAANKA